MRDDFSAKTKEILAKRVGFICSNPNCRKHTSGPNTDEARSINIGIAAHITAASSNGPRFDENITSEERQNISNGIWLCSNCASLIDRDVEKYPIELLLEWKNSAEKEMIDALQGKKSSGEKPFLEADLTWDSKSRQTNGYSPKNLKVFKQPIPAGTDLYQYWTLKWRLKLKVYNNSKVPAYNIQITENNGNKFDYLQELPRINNIKELDFIELEAIYTKFLEGTSKEADKELTTIPKDLIGKELNIKYFDDDRNELITKVIFGDSHLSNERE